MLSTLYKIVVLLNFHFIEGLNKIFICYETQNGFKRIFVHDFLINSTSETCGVIFGSFSTCDLNSNRFRIFVSAISLSSKSSL